VILARDLLNLHKSIGVVMRSVLFVLLVAFSVSAFAGLPAGVILKGGPGPYRTYWCGQFLAIDDIKNVEDYLLNEYPDYFESSREVKEGEKTVALTKFKTFNRIGVPELTFKNESSSRYDAKYEFAWADATGPISFAISVDGVHATSDERVVAAMTDTGAVLVSLDYKFLALCREYSSADSFIKSENFLRGLETKVDDIVDEVKSCEPLLLAQTFKSLH
jgi:hypothetical protein